MHFHSLCVLLLPIIAIWQFVVLGASAATSSSEQDELAKMHSCRDWYNIDPTPLAEKTFSPVYRAHDMKSNEKVIIKVYSTFKDFEHEKTIFHVLKARIFMSSVDKETTEIDRRKFEESWSHFVRLLNKCRMKIKFLDLPALVIELLDEQLSEAIELERTKSRKRRHDRSLVTAPQKQPSDNASPISRFKSYAYQLLAAVDVLHRMSVFHLDVKPENVGLTHDGILKLFDFGLSSSKSITRSYVGTLSFSAPEMDVGLAKVVGQSNQTDKMDIWSVGCTIYEIFTGHSMFHAVEDIIKRVKGAMEKNPGPSSDCSREAVYFYLKWTYFGSLTVTITPKEFGRAERRARERCPQIFSRNIIKFLQMETPYAYAYTKSEDSRSERQHITEFQLKMRDLEANKSQKKMRLDPSSTEAGELVALLLDLLMFDFNKRVTAHTALTHQDIFKNFPHQNTERDKFGTEI